MPNRCASAFRAPISIGSSGDMLLELVNPVTLEVALTVQQELQARLDESDRLRRQQVERARYEADLAQRRYMRVDPENRLVADSLEADWNQKLRALAETQQEYEQHREQDRRIFDDEQRAAILALAQDFPRLWRDPATEDRDRKRMIRLLVEDVTMLRGERITLHLRFRGGARQDCHSAQSTEIMGKLDDGFGDRGQDRPAAGDADLWRNRGHAEQRRFSLGQAATIYGPLHCSYSEKLQASTAV